MLLLFALLFQYFAFGYNGEKNHLKDYAANFLNKKADSRKNVKQKVSSSDMSIIVDKEQLVLIKDDIGDYVVLTKNNHPEVIGYSLNGSSNGSEVPPSMLWFMDLSNNALAMGESVTEDTVPSWLPDHIDPLLTTTWNQGYPYNAKCPQMKNSEGKIVTCPTGCVATAMAQIMAYYKFPDSGYGVQQYSFKDKQIELDFETINFDWENMLNHYDYIEGKEQNFNETEADAVSNLLFACGVSTSMSYGPYSSGAYITEVGYALTHYFKYDQACYYYGTKKSRLGKILFNISKSMPVICASRGGHHGDEYADGHAVVFDGYDTNGNVHVNWGWGGYFDGYFNIFALGTHDVYSMGSEDIIADIKPSYYKNHVDYILSLKVTEAGSLSKMIKEEDMDAIEGLKITGELNVNDFEFIRKMDSLYYLDLSDVQIVDTSNQFLEEFPQYALSYSAYAAKKNLGEVILPNSCTVIGEAALSNCHMLKSVTLGKNVKIIGDRAFWDCEKLESICLPEGVTSIRTQAFDGCTNLKSINIPESVEGIGTLAFYCCKALETINIPKRVSYIGKDAFAGCKSLSTPLVIGDESHSTRLYDGAFHGCENIPSVKFVGEVFINPEIFWNCTSLSHVELSDEVYLSNGGIFNPFCYCPNLNSIVVSKAHPKFDSRNDCNAIIETKTNLLFVGCKETVIPPTVEVIKDGAFQGCSKMVSIGLPESVKEVKGGAFKDCYSLESIKLSDNLTKIGKETFRGCLSLKSIFIPKFVKTIDSPLFQNCPNLKTIIVDKNNVTFDSRDNCNAIIETKNNALRCGCVNSVIPNSVTSIGSSAFNGCTGLTSVTIPNSVTSIDVAAFYNCSNLTSINIPANVTTIGSGAFENCPLSFVFTEILNPFNIESNVFAIDRSYGDPDFSSATLYVPIGTKTIYMSKFPWNRFPEIIEDDVPLSMNSTNEQTSMVPMTYYSLDGKPVSRPTNGFYIIKYSDGSVRKRVFK